MSKIVFVSGPSGMAKTKVKEKLEHLAYPLGLKFQRVIVATSRAMRPGESEGNPWFFKSAADIEKDHRTDPDRYLMVHIRKSEPQGLDTQTEITDKLSDAGVLWCELHVTWLVQIENWVKHHTPDTRIVKVFFAPLSDSEILEQMSVSGLPWDRVIENEVLRRMIARRQANLDNMSIEKMQKRAEGAAKEFEQRRQYDCVIVNHQGEDSTEWGAPTEFPTGEAARVVAQFLQIYRA